MHLVTFLSTFLLVNWTNACFCPMVISNSCGCGGGGYNSYAGGGYGGGYNTGYSSGYANNANSGSYAVFYRDLTPFRQPYYQQAPAYQQSYYPQVPLRQPQQQQIFQLPTSPYVQPQAAPPAPPPPQPRPQYIAPVRPAPTPYRPAVQRPVYTQPAATVAPLPRTTLHDNGYGEEQVVVVTTPAPVVVVTADDAFVTAPTTVAPAAIDEVPDFVDEPAKPAAEEKEEFYYVYYDEKGNKVGDSRSGTTFAPENVIDETSSIAPAAVQVEVTTEKVQVESVNESYDDVVEESNVSERTTSYSPDSITTAAVFRQETATVAGTDVVYEDETVEYEDEETPEEFTKKPTSSGNLKRTVSDNQILVDAAETTASGYRNVAKGVKIVKRYHHDARKIHEN